MGIGANIPPCPEIQYLHTRDLKINCNTIASFVQKLKFWFEVINYYYCCYNLLNIILRSSVFFFKMLLEHKTRWVLSLYIPENEIINRPGVAGAVLQSPPSLINSFSDSWFVEISSLASHWPSDHLTSSRPLIFLA